MKKDYTDVMKILIFIIIFFLSFVLFACNGGWSVAGVDIFPSDSSYSNFITIIDQDSIKHSYVRTTAYGGIFTGDNWCYKHNQWEKVEKK